MINLAYDIDTQYVEVKAPHLKHIQEVIAALNGGKQSPRRRGITLVTGKELVSIASVSLSEERVLLRYCRHSEDKYDYPPFAKLLDPLLPHLDDENSLVETVSSTGEVEDVCKYETVPKQFAIEVVTHLFNYHCLPKGLKWNMY